MLKMKKKSLLVVLTFAMVLALSCGAWAVTGQVRANGSHQNVADDIEVSGEHGIYALNQGTVSNDGYYIKVSGSSHGIYAITSSDVTMSGDITTQDASAIAVYSRSGSSIDIRGNLKTSGSTAYGVHANEQAYAFMSGDIATSGDNARGLYANDKSTIEMYGTITTTGDQASGAYSRMGSNIEATAAITTSGRLAHGVSAYSDASLTVNGSTETSGSEADGVYAEQYADVTVNGNVTVSGTNAYGLQGVIGSTVTMNDGTLTIIDETSAGMLLEQESEANLNNVTVDAETLLITSTSATLNASDNSVLSGDVLHGGLGDSAGTLDINLVDSTLEGAVIAGSNVGSLTAGVVDIVLENSDWIVTGDSNTNGTLTGIGDSSVDTSNAPENTVVQIDEIVGEIDFNLKPGDTLGVTNTDGNNSFSSSDPDVLEVVQNPDGSWSIVSKGEGDADLTYTYKDPATGETKTVTTGVSSEYADGQSKPDTDDGGSTPTSGSHSSSGCNAGFGILALLGLAFVAKKK